MADHEDWGTRLGRVARSGARVASLAVPYGLVALRRRRLRRRRKRGQAQQRTAEASHYERARERQTASRSASREPFRYEAAIGCAVSLGVPEDQVRAGSVPERNLEYIADRLHEAFPQGIPSIGVHVGNFIGVSLVALATEVTARHADSLVIAVDPNLPHRGAIHNQDRVCRLVERFGLSDRVVLVCGYSDERAPSGQGAVVGGYDPLEHAADEAAPTSTLENLARILGEARVDWVLVDGNHNGEYLRAELRRLTTLVRPDGLVFLDDCNAAWPEIERVFQDVSARSEDWAVVGTDGRIGVLRRVPRRNATRRIPSSV